MSSQKHQKKTEKLSTGQKNIGISEACGWLLIGGCYYRVVARKAKNLSNSYLFLQRITFTKFFKDLCYITHIDA